MSYAFYYGKKLHVAATAKAAQVAITNSVGLLTSAKPESAGSKSWRVHKGPRKSTAPPAAQHLGFRNDAFLLPKCTLSGPGLLSKTPLKLTDALKKLLKFQHKISGIR